MTNWQEFARKALNDELEEEFAWWAKFEHIKVRPGWDEYFLSIAWTASSRGDCIRRQVGAVLVDQDHIIRGLGYNGSEPGGPSCLAGECPRCLSDVPSGSAYEGCIEKHAEDNCLRNTSFPEREDGNHWRWDKYILTMYITCEPCMGCKEKMYDFGVAKVIWPEGHLDFVSKL